MANLFKAGDIVVMKDTTHSAYILHVGRQARVEDPPYQDRNNPDLLWIEWISDGKHERIYDYRFALVSTPVPSIKIKIETAKKVEVAKKQATPEDIWKAIVDVASGG